MYRSLCLAGPSVQVLVVSVHFFNQTYVKVTPDACTKSTHGTGETRYSSMTISMVMAAGEAEC